jgi:nigerose phosphorylase
MLNLFKERFSQNVKKANWEYYEPRTEHGSSLSPCVYALLAADIGYSEWGYKYYLKTATIDMTGESKQYVSTLYIGGTHPAANGGVWMSAVQGFGGLSADAEMIHLNPSLPSKWEMMQFGMFWRNQQLSFHITRNTVKIGCSQENTEICHFNVKGRTVACGTGQEITAVY